MYVAGWSSFTERKRLSRETRGSMCACMWSSPTATTSPNWRRATTARRVPGTSSKWRRWSPRRRSVRSFERGQEACGRIHAKAIPSASALAARLRGRRRRLDSRKSTTIAITGWKTSSAATKHSHVLGSAHNINLECIVFAADGTAVITGFGSCKPDGEEGVRAKIALPKGTFAAPLCRYRPVRRSPLLTTDICTDGARKALVSTSNPHSR